MSDTSTPDDFYEEDETPEEFWAGWRQGEKGFTTGTSNMATSYHTLNFYGPHTRPVKLAGPWKCRWYLIRRCVRDLRKSFHGG